MFTNVLYINSRKKDFPILTRKVHGKKLIYHDNAATTQKPLSVINAQSDCNKTFNSNIHRGIHTLSEETSLAYESVRSRVAEFIGGVDERGIIFTRNATESLNLLSSAKTNA